MKMLFGWMLCVFLLCVVAAACGAQENGVVVLAQGKPLAFDAMLDALSRADVVFVGENHDHKQGHALELAILQGLHARNPSMAFAMEMFERDVQIVLDEYLHGYITESSFLQAARPWPNYKTDYAPLVEFCKAQQIPVLASNAPRRYVNIVSRKGQDALLELPRTSRAYLPALPYSMAIPPEYDRELTQIFSGGHDTQAAVRQSAPPAMPSPEHLKQAQGLWDDTMADSLARFQRKTHRKILHINGAMHSDSGFGIVDRLRHADPRLKILLVTIRPSDRYPEPPADLPATAADYILVTPAPPAEKNAPSP
ncbi:MAG TPA: ChaN family lipoprotein [Chthonomonadaceae bacterium]|nr:ChaN family lipoprotein [Chthonomonadaceae bacterium]